MAAKTPVSVSEDRPMRPLFSFQLGPGAMEEAQAAALRGEACLPRSAACPPRKSADLWPQGTVSIDRVIICANDLIRDSEGRTWPVADLLVGGPSFGTRWSQPSWHSGSLPDRC